MASGSSLNSSSANLLQASPSTSTVTPYSGFNSNQNQKTTQLMASQGSHTGYGAMPTTNSGYTAMPHTTSAKDLNDPSYASMSPNSFGKPIVSSYGALPDGRQGSTYGSIPSTAEADNTAVNIPPDASYGSLPASTGTYGSIPTPDGAYEGLPRSNQNQAYSVMPAKKSPKIADTYGSLPSRNMSPPTEASYGSLPSGNGSYGSLPSRNFVPPQQEQDYGAPTETSSYGGLPPTEESLPDPPYQ